MQIVERDEEQWNKANLQVFWGEIAPCDHVVQIYESDQTFLTSLEGFIGSGLIAGDSIIIIVTPQHRSEIERRLKRQGFNIEKLTQEDRYLALDVDEMLSKFMINKWPDDYLFFELITSLLKRVKKNNRKVRAFGEMVAVLWQKGFSGATVQLEYLWNMLHENNEFSLFCAYPKIGFTQDINASVEKICSAHSKVIDGSPRPSTEIYYKLGS